MQTQTGLKVWIALDQLKWVLNTRVYGMFADICSMKRCPTDGSYFVTSPCPTQTFQLWRSSWSKATRFETPAVSLMMEDIFTDAGSLQIFYGGQKDFVDAVDDKNRFFQPVTHGQARFTQFNIVDRFGQINQDARLHAEFVCDRDDSGTQTRYQPVAEGDMAVFAWLLINFHKQSIQVYDRNQTFRDLNIRDTGQQQWDEMKPPEGK
ncbi:hypothetical protein F66182_6948 [Fusarium sp. NRRL 66182]|nr:hypothetical protein F66182_6948 [Fusarium sp. NRRL 66182]